MGKCCLTVWTVAVADPNLQIRGGGPGHPDPEIWGGGCWSPKKFFSALWTSVWSKNKGGVGPSRGSTTELAVSSLDFEQSLFC